MNIKRMKASDLKGRKIKLLDAVGNRGGFLIPAGAICEITSAHHNLSIEYTCECCGVKVSVSNIYRDAKYIELVEEDAPETAKGE